MDGFQLDLKDYTRSPSPPLKRPRHSLGLGRKEERESGSNEYIEFSCNHHEGTVGSSSSSVCMITQQSNNNVYSNPSKEVKRIGHSDDDENGRNKGEIQDLSEKRGLGVWRYDVKKRMRIYTALDGEVLYKKEAVERSRQDKQRTGFESRLYLRTLCDNCELLYNVPSKLLKEKGMKAALAIMDIDVLKLENWGVPPTIRSKYHAAGVSSLFEWQVECLMLNDASALKHNKNLVYSAPTSGGKTLVCEILMLHKLARAEKNKGFIFFVVPFISLAEEKANYFRNMWSDINIGVKTFHGSDASKEITTDVDIAVCTIERANVLLNQLIEEEREHLLKMVVVDEVHLLSDANRGFLMEVLLSKIKFICDDQHARLRRREIQLVCMSATLPNIDHVAAWISADLFVSEFRPVQLVSQVYFDGKLYECVKGGNDCNEVTFNCIKPVLPPTTSSKAHIIPSTAPNCPGCGNPCTILTARKDRREFWSCPSRPWCEKIPFMGYVPGQNISNAIVNGGNRSKIKENLRISSVPTDPGGRETEDMVALCIEPLAQKKQILLFCNSKSRCEACINQIFDHMKFPNKSDRIKSLIASFPFNYVDGLDERIYVGRFEILNQLRNSPVGLCFQLQKLILIGLAYHHAGLTTDERKIIEKGYRDGFISILATTSTLAAGVNLPAHRVVIRTPQIAGDDLSISNFRQMCGRAGRTNLNVTGEVILMIDGRKHHRKLCGELFHGKLAPLESALHHGYGGGIEKLLLDIIACRKIKCESQLESFMKCTLLWTQKSIDNELSKVLSWTNEALKFIKENNFILNLPCNDNDGDKRPLVASALGIATVSSGINPKESVEVLQSLLAARKKLILRSNFHCVFLVTPPSSNIEPPWSNMATMVTDIYSDYEDIKPVADFLGVKEKEMQDFARRPPKFMCNDPRTRFYRRFFTAILLYRLVQEVPLQKVGSSLDIKRGRLQALQSDAASFCHMVIAFCKKLNWDYLATALTPYAGRLSFGAQEELMPLIRIGPEMPAFRARALMRNGIRSPSDILRKGKNKVLEILLDIIPFEGDEPLHAKTRQTSRDEIINHINAGNNMDKKQWHKSCDRLADSIMKRAYLYLQEEEISNQTIHAMSLAMTTTTASTDHVIIAATSNKASMALVTSVTSHVF